MAAPRKLKDVAPAFPKGHATLTSSGPLVTEVLIDPSGKVARVWLVQSGPGRRWSRAIEHAVAEAIRQWRYSPMVVDGKAVSVCMTVSTIVDVR
jgi:outer membrane biosynthesis protein TonB